MGIRILIVVLIALLVYLWLRYRARMRVSQSIVINAPIDQVFQNVLDLKKWPIWSPWLVAEKNALHSVSAEGKKFCWSGLAIGKGEMSIVKEVSNQSIDQALLFLKPFRSRAKVRWLFEAQEDGVRVQWNMASRMPFFLFWLAPVMSAYVQNDYDRGLRRLKQFIETGSIDHQVEVTGVVDFSATSFIAKRSATKKAQLSTKMKKDFQALMSYLKTHQLEAKTGLSIYEKFDYLSGDVVYLAGLLGDFSTVENDQFSVHSMPSMKAFKVIYRGEYTNLDNGWAALMVNVQARKFKPMKGCFPFERYVVGPNTEPDPKKWVTEIYFPVHV